MTDIIEKSPLKETLPVLTLKDLVLFPDMILSFDIVKAQSIAALNYAMNKKQLIFVTMQKSSKKNNINEKNLNSIGVLAEVKQVLRQNDDVIKVMLKGKQRAKLLSITKYEPFIEASIVLQEDKPVNSVKAKAAIRTIRSVFNEYVRLRPMIPSDIALNLDLFEDPGKAADYLASNLSFECKEKKGLLNQINGLTRLENLTGILLNELNILSAEQDINLKLLKKLEKEKREYFLRGQKEIISEELGENDVKEEADELLNKVKALSLPYKIKDQLIKECERLSKMQNGVQEANVIRNYIELCLDLPWNKKTKETISLTKAQDILNEDHYGLEKVKDRIIESLAVRKLTKSKSGQIICLVGPPGVGKTSIAKSIARAINRKYARISLGGVHDEADIRGHRKTYVGAMPGRIISAIRSAGSKNPLILLDEIDKLSKDQYGDPTSALLEVLDVEQNNSFFDHYIDMSFDLSDVLFITTANNCDSIPEPLLDRMEIIEVVSYTPEEKFNIAKKYLIPKQLEKHGLLSYNFKIDDDALYELILNYTKEAGVRNLERNIASLMRKAAKNIVTGKSKEININISYMEEILGPKKFVQDKLQKEAQIGVSTGLAWTQTGGETISIEAATMPGTGKIKLTGSLGDIMKESAQTAVSYIRSNAEKFDIDPDFYSKLDIHIHVPKGAIPKDGPSAGITLASAILSALTNIPIKQNTAMTGEITLRGRVLPIGGLREKTMAAFRAGIDTVILPKENESDLSEIDSIVRDKINFVSVENMSNVLDNLLVK